MISEWVLFVTGATIADVALWPKYIADFALAFAFGIVFQYFAIAPGARISTGSTSSLPRAETGGAVGSPNT